MGPADPFLPLVRDGSICGEDDSPPQFSMPFEHGEGTRSFHARERILRLLAFDCRPQYLHRFHLLLILEGQCSDPQTKDCLYVP